MTTCTRYRRAVNMTAAQFNRWAASPCSRLASLDRRPIARNRKLLGKPCSAWTAADEREARKTISFIARHRAQRRVQGPGKPSRPGCPTRRDIGLCNWAFDPTGACKR